MRVLGMAVFLLFSVAASGKATASSEVSAALRAIQSAPVGLITLVGGVGSPFVFVHGIDIAPEPPEWVAPLEAALASGRPVYFFKWSKRQSLASSASILASGLGRLLQEHEGATLTFLAHSAGGLVSTLALDQLRGTDPQALARIHFITAATPFFGYGAPGLFAYTGAPFVGRGTIDIGLGRSRRDLSGAGLASCVHWINECAHDPEHACPRSGVSPQRGPEDGSGQLPCGNGQIRTATGEDHGSVVERAFVESAR